MTAVVFNRWVTLCEKVHVEHSVDKLFIYERSLSSMTSETDHTIRHTFSNNQERGYCCWKITAALIVNG